MNKYQQLKEECYEANMMLPKLNLVLFTFGNVSCLSDDRTVFAIKPSGVPYEELKVDDIVICDLKGNAIDGKMRPSSDTKTHALLYTSWEGVNGIAHTHSTYATGWAQALKDIPIFGTTHADHLTFDIPCAPPMGDEYIKGDYEHNTGFQIIDCLQQKGMSYKEVEMILVGNHAPFTWGKSAKKAVYNSAVLEECAKMASLTLQINPNAARLKEALISKHFERKHGINSYYGQE